MSISLEEQNNLLCLVSGMYHHDISESFRMSCLGLTNDSLVIYDDHVADQVSGGNFYYGIKRRTPLADINKVLIEDVYTQTKFYYPHRVNVISKTEQESFAFYYNGDQSKRVANLVNFLKKRGIKVSKRNFSLD